MRSAFGRPAAMAVTAFGLVCASAAVYQTAAASHAHAPTVRAAVEITSTPGTVPSRAVGDQVSRSQARPTLPVVPAAKPAAAPRTTSAASPTAVSPTTAATLGPASPAQAQQMAWAMLSAYGWNQAQWPCLNKLWTQESSWITTAENPSSGAYGIPQSLPASKMASAGADYRTNTRTQLTWGMQYVKEAYGSPCQAWDFHLAHNWY